MSVGGLIRAGGELFPPTPEPVPGFRLPPKRRRRDRHRRWPPVHRRRRRRDDPYNPVIPDAPVIPGKRAAVTKLGGTSTSSGSGYNRTVSYTLNAGDDRICVALIGMGGTGTSISDVTFDGVSGTIQENQESSDSRGRCAIAYRVFGSGASDTFDVDLTASGSFGQSGMTVVAYENVDQSTPITDSDSGTHSLTTSTSLTVTSAVDEMCVDVMCNTGSLTEWDEDVGQTELAVPLDLNSTVDAVLHRSEEAGAASVTMGWSGSSAFGCQAIIALKEAAGGGGNPTISNIYGDDFSPQLAPYDGPITVDGTNFEASQGTGRVVVSDNGGGIGVGNEIEQPIDSWSDTQITLTAFDPGQLLGTSQSGTLYWYVENDTGNSNATGRGHPAGHFDERFATGVFDTPGTTGNFDITHPKLNDNKVRAVLFWTTGATSDDTDQPDAYLGIGMADGTTEYAQHVFSEDGVTGTTGRQSWNDRCIHQEPNGGTIENVATFVSSIVGGFRVNFTTATAGRKIHWCAWAGEDVQAEVGEATVSAGTVSSLPFDPTFVVAMTTGQGSIGSSTHTVSSFGFFNSSLEQAVLASYWGQGSNQGSNGTYSSNDGYNAQLFNGSLTWEMSVTSIFGTGWNWSGSNSDDFYYIALSFTKMQSDVSQYAKDTGAAPDTQTLSPNLSNSQRPQGYLAIGTVKTNETSTSANGALCIGAFDGYYRHVAAVRFENNANPTDNSHRSTEGALCQIVSPTTGAVDAEAAPQPIGDDTTPDIIWDPNTGTASLFHVATFGDVTWRAADRPKGFMFH